VRAQVVRGLPPYSGGLSSARPYVAQPCVLAFGSFDGIHRGHQALLQKVTQLAQDRGLSQRTVLSFYPHPLVTLGRDQKRKPILSLSQRLERLSEFGINACVLLKFSKERSQQSARDFIKQVLIDALRAQVVVVGVDAHIGRGREAGVDGIHSILREYGAELVVVEYEMDQAGLKIGSRRIRESLLAGKMADVREALGFWHQMRGRVVRGDGRGKGLSFPTANLSTTQLLPKRGVYAAWAILDGVRYRAVVNIGERPTFHGSDLRIEAHLLDYTGVDFYGARMALELVHFIREEKQFAVVQKLIEQISLDSIAAVQFLSTLDVARQRGL
jgi:riboflavin kinase/FMN adenylyltransferase